MPSWRCTLASGPGWARRQASRFVQRRGAALQVQKPSCFKLKCLLRRFWRERMQVWRLQSLWWCTRKLSEWREIFIFRLEIWSQALGLCKSNRLNG
ncbi:hypothetical protein OIDMADRAFT_17373, partial [Oidiodendron maius Zn]